MLFVVNSKLLLTQVLTALRASTSHQSEDVLRVSFESHIYSSPNQLTGANYSLRKIGDLRRHRHRPVL